MALISIFHFKKAKTTSSARFTSPYQTHQNNEAQLTRYLRGPQGLNAKNTHLRPLLVGNCC